MKRSNWIKQYHDEQEQIHMPASCRQNILDQIAQEEIVEREETIQWKPVQAPRKASSWRIAIVALILLILTGFAATLAVSTQRPATNVPDVENIELFADPQATEATGAASEDTITPEDVTSVSKKLIYYRCLNSVLYQHQISGSVNYYDSQAIEGDDVSMQGTFALNYDTDRYFGRVRQYEATDYTNLVGMTTYYHLNHEDTTLKEMYVLHDSYVENTHTYERVVFDSTQTEFDLLSQEEIEATPVEEMPIYPDHLSGMDLFDICLVPTQKTLTYLSDFDQWEIIDVVTHDPTQEPVAWTTEERTVVYINGEIDAVDSDIASFSLVVDYETGIWLSFTTLTPSGEVVDYMTVTNLDFYEDDAHTVAVRSLTAGEQNLIEAQYTRVSSTVIENEEIMAEDDD